MNSTRIETVWRLARRITITLFCALAGLCMAALGVVTMDRPDTVNLSHVAFFCTVVLILAAIADTVEN